MTVSLLRSCRLALLFYSFTLAAWSLAACGGSDKNETANYVEPTRAELLQAAETHPDVQVVMQALEASGCAPVINTDDATKTAVQPTFDQLFGVKANSGEGLSFVYGQGDCPDGDDTSITVVFDRYKNALQVLGMHKAQGEDGLHSNITMYSVKDGALVTQTANEWLQQSFTQASDELTKLQEEHPEQAPATETSGVAAKVSALSTGQGCWDALYIMAGYARSSLGFGPEVCGLDCLACESTVAQYSNSSATADAMVTTLVDGLVVRALSMKAVAAALSLLVELITGAVGVVFSEGLLAGLAYFAGGLTTLGWPLLLGIAAAVVAAAITLYALAKAWIRDLHGFWGVSPGSETACSQFGSALCRTSEEGLDEEAFCSSNNSPNVDSQCGQLATKSDHLSLHLDPTRNCEREADTGIHFCPTCPQDEEGNYLCPSP
ncbi:MAG: hypothetical protein IPJ88_06115 [Myxococcales bacterium]|nr:MAG: hypothetical protein IPJ88_06115 [Myxococcales bacterium]